MSIHAIKRRLCMTWWKKVSKRIKELRQRRKFMRLKMWQITPHCASSMLPNRQLFIYAFSTGEAKLFTKWKSLSPMKGGLLKAFLFHFYCRLLEACGSRDVVTWYPNKKSSYKNVSMEHAFPRWHFCTQRAFFLFLSLSLAFLARHTTTWKVALRENQFTSAFSFLFFSHTPPSKANRIHKN